MSYSQIVGGPLLQTASEVSTQLEQIDSEAQNLDVSIRQHIGDSQFLASWGAWLASWSSFFNRYHESSFNIYSTGSGTVSRQAETYHTQLLAWQSSYQNALGGSANLPLPSSGGSTNPQSGNNLSNLSQIAGEATTKILILGALGLAAAAAAVYASKR